MRLFFGPTDVLHAASSITTGATRAVEEVVDLVDLLGRAGDLMDRAEALVASAERSLARADDLVVDARATLERADDLVADAKRSLVRADVVVDRAETLLGQGEEILVPVRALAADALPKAAHVVAAVGAEEVTAARGLVDRLPRLVDSLENDVLPLMSQLGDVGPDVHAILDSVTDLTRALQGLPGVSMLQRRADRKEGEES